MFYKMLRVKYIIILVLLLNTLLLNAQKTMDYMIEELKSKSKNDLIQIAKDLLVEKSEITVDANDFDCRVWDDSYGRIDVIFRRSIRYLSNEIEDVNYDITIDLAKKVIAPFEREEKLFYTSSKRAGELIEELKAKGLLPNSNQPDIEYTITENELYYLISCFDNLPHIDKNLIANQEHPYLSKTLVNKKTGEICFFKGNNPFFYLSQLTFEHYYQESLYAILMEQDISNKNEIVKIADSILNERYPDLKLSHSDFEIMILGNYKDLIVKYRRYARFNKGSEKTAFDLAVNIITGEISPFDSSETPFYSPSSEEKRVISTMQNLVPFEQSSNIEHSVSVNEEYFFVTSISERSTKKYFIDKKNNEVVWTNESYTLQVNNREDLSLQEHYKRMNTFFDIRSTDNKPLINMVSAILQEKQLSSNIKLEDYRFAAKSSKTEVEVTLTRLVKFTVLKYKYKSNFDYDLKVNLVTKTIAHDPERFYVPTEEDAVVIELIEDQLADYFDESEKPYYPIEISEENDYFEIKVSGVDDYRSYDDKQYRMNKQTNAIEVVYPLTNPIYPSPAMEPLPRREIED